MQDPIIERRKRIAIATAAGFVLLILLAAIINSIVNNIADVKNSISISGLSECATDIDYATTTEVQKKYYNYVAAQLEVLGLSATSEQYAGAVREETCHSSEFADSVGNAGFNIQFVLDIEELGFSYQATFNYVRAGDPALVDVDLGTPLLYCLPETELIYGVFSCADNPMIYQNGAIELNSIENLLPFTDNQNYLAQLITSTETPSGKAIVITYIPDRSIYLSGDTAEFQATYRAEIEEYLTSHGVNLSEYQFIEKWK